MKGTFLNISVTLSLMKPAEALRLVDFYSREIEIEDITKMSLARLKVCV